MTKTIAAIVVILVATLMAWGIKGVADRNIAAEVVNNNASEPASESAKPEAESGLMLTVSNPPEGATVNTPKITVSGKTAAKAEVMIDDEELEADEDGDFSTELDLDEGENEISVTANDDSGEWAEKTVKVTYEPED